MEQPNFPPGQTASQQLSFCAQIRMPPKPAVQIILHACSGKKKPKKKPANGTSDHVVQVRPWLLEAEHTVHYARLSYGV